MKAELRPDAGAAAADDQFFRSAAFLGAEATSHTLVFGGTRVPVLVRDIPGSPGLSDAISPYGYPGGTGAAEADPGAVDWSAAGLVSLFLRDRVSGPAVFADATERSRLQLHDPAAASGMRSRLAEQVRHNEREGWEVSSTAGPESSDLQRAAFLSLYTETMTRAGAAPRYFFDAAYFDEILGFDRSWLLVAQSSRAEVGAGAIAALSDDVLHYYLGGTGDEALEASPFKNVVVAMMRLADELNVPLNLGGGVRPGDGLEGFKRGFANAEMPFRTHEVVCDAEAYARLAGGREAEGFFPAYRAP